MVDAMSRARLVIESAVGYEYFIGWDCNDGEGVNLGVGEALDSVRASPESYVDEADVMAVELAVANHCEALSMMRRWLNRWTFDSAASARKALVIAKAAQAQALSKRPPLEDWEQRALAAGWKPPKGRL
jgi:hypothetical protein